tara:strand:- start:32847 stop:33020 length:174 start_codon:yes stop_codon:yes gene_type:complete
VPNSIRACQRFLCLTKGKEKEKVVRNPTPHIFISSISHFPTLNKYFINIKEYKIQDG